MGPFEFKNVKEEEPFGKYIHLLSCCELITIVMHVHYIHFKDAVRSWSERKKWEKANLPLFK